MDASLEKDKNGVLYLLFRKNENSYPVKVELSSLLDIKPSSETLGNHLRNLLSPYQQMIDVLDHICDENETDDIKNRLLTLLYKQLEVYLKNPAFRKIRLFHHISLLKTLLYIRVSLR